MEAGPVVFPAYPQTSVGVRSLTDEQRERLVEEYTRTSIDVEDESVGPEAVSEESETEREEASTPLETPSESEEVPDTSEGYNHSVRERKLALKFKFKEQ